MNYTPVRIRDLPADQDLLQDLAHTTLHHADLTLKYGLIFERTSDDLSAVELCILRDTEGHYFALVDREEFSSDWKTAIRTSTSTEQIEMFIPKMLMAFVNATDFQEADIEQIWGLWNECRRRASIPQSGLRLSHQIAVQF